MAPTNWKASFIVLVVLAIVFGLMFLQIIRPFLLPVLFAAVLAMLFRPLYLRLVNRLGGRDRIAAVLTTAVILFAAVIPIAGALTLAGREVVSVGRELIRTTRPENPDIAAEVARLRALLAEEQFAELREAILEGTPPSRALVNVPASEPYEILRDLEDKYEFEAVQSHFRGFELPEGIRLLREHFEAWIPLPYRERVITAAGTAAQRAMTTVYERTREILADVIGFLIGLIVLLLALYYFLAEGPAMLGRLKRLLPIDEPDQVRLFRKFEEVCRGVVLATFLSAITQAVLAGIGFAVAGVGNVWLLGALTLLLSMIPFLGAASVWIPVCLLLVVQDRYLAAALLAIYCAGVVSTSDNVVKVYVIQGQSRLHPLVVFISILGALRIYGLWGIFVGPIVAMIFYLLLEIIRDKQGDAPPPIVTPG